MSNKNDNNPLLFDDLKNDQINKQNINLTTNKHSRYKVNPVSIGKESNKKQNGNLNNNNKQDFTDRNIDKL